MAYMQWGHITVNFTGIWNATKYMHFKMEQKYRTQTTKRNSNENEEMMIIAVNAIYAIA